MRSAFRARPHRGIAFLAFAMLVLTGLMAFPASARPVGPRAVPNPLEAGPYEVRSQTYDLGDTAFQPDGFPGKVELRGVVHAPRNARGQRLPAVLFLHGRHEACGAADGEATYGQWPCRKPFTAIPSYRGYDYAGKLLASHGYVVISISADGIGAADHADATFGQTARGRLIQKHLDLWKQWTSHGDGPFGTEFQDAIDFRRIGTMGHSRGGEGIVSQLKVNAAAGSPYGIQAVLALAPTDFLRQVVTGVPMGVLLSMCDADQPDLQGVHYYDDASYAERGDPAPKYQVAIAGANHYFYNTAWSPDSGEPGAMDDWDRAVKMGGKGGACASGSGERLTQKQQQAVAASYITSFFRLQLGGESQFAGLWEGRDALPSSASFAKVSTTFHAPDRPGKRLDINRLRSDDDLRRNAAGGGVTLEGFSDPGFCGGESHAKRCLGGDYTKEPYRLEPHGYMQILDTEPPGTNLLQLRWDRPGAFLRNELSEGSRDVAPYRNLTFRSVVDFSDPRNADATRIPLRVVLADSKGRQASVRTTGYGQDPTVPDLLTTVTDPKSHSTLPIRRLLLSQVRIPVQAFRSIDLGDIRSVTVVCDGTERGALDITDLSFSE